MNRRSSLLVLGSVAMGLAMHGAPPPARAQGGGEVRIDGCIGQNGQLRVVGASGDCRKNESPIDWNREGPQGPQGPAGPAGPTGPEGRPGPSGQINGVMAFTSNVAFTVPPGITRLQLEAWGAGGGGGGSEDLQPGCANGGGGGGGGGYARGVVEVTPEVTYQIVVGAGGAAGTGTQDGAPGGDTRFEALDATVLLSAAGGAGGATGRTGVIGAGGSGGQGSAPGGILVGGANGSDGTPCVSIAGGAGAGGASVIGARMLPASAGGNGANNEGGAGRRGNPGYLIVQW